MAPQRGFDGKVLDIDKCPEIPKRDKTGEIADSGTRCNEQQARAIRQPWGCYISPRATFLRRKDIEIQSFGF